MTIEQTQGAGFLSRVFGTEYEVHDSGWLSDIVDLGQAIFEPGTESFFEQLWYSLAATRKADHSLACLVVNYWDLTEEDEKWDCRSELEHFGDNHGVIVLCPQSGTWQPQQRILCGRDMQLLLAQADGYPYDFFEGEADDETLEGLFGSATATPNVEGVPVPFERAEGFDGQSGSAIVRSLLDHRGTGARTLSWKKACA